MNNIDATLEISRKDKKLASVSVIMPTWTRSGNDNKMYVMIPLFGLETFGHDEKDCDVAVEEALKCFCELAENHGHGLDFELEFMGWKLQENSIDHDHIFNIEPTTPAFESLLQTGDQMALSFQVA